MLIIAPSAAAYGPKLPLNDHYGIVVRSLESGRQRFHNYGGRSKDRNVDKVTKAYFAPKVLKGEKRKFSVSAKSANSFVQSRHSIAEGYWIFSAPNQICKPRNITANGTGETATAMVKNVAKGEKMPLNPAIIMIPPPPPMKELPGVFTASATAM